MSPSLLRDEYVLLFLSWRGRCCRFAVELPLIDVPLSRSGGTRAGHSGLTSVSAHAVRGKARKQADGRRTRRLVLFADGCNPLRKKDSPASSVSRMDVPFFPTVSAKLILPIVGWKVRTVQLQLKMLRAVKLEQHVRPVICTGQSLYS